VYANILNNCWKSLSYVRTNFKQLQQVLLFSIIIIDNINSKNNNKFKSRRNKKINRKTREIITIYRTHYSKADIDELYVTRKGGRGLLQIEAMYKAEVISFTDYLNTKYTEDQFVNIVTSHQSYQHYMNSTIIIAAKIVEELNQSDENSNTNKEGMQHTKARLEEFLNKKLDSKIMHNSTLEVQINT